MRRHAALLVLLATVASFGAATAEPAPAAKTRLKQFGSCGELLRYAKSHARPLVGAYGFGSGLVTETTAAASAPAARASGAPVAGVDYSTTNVQEEGVDEPDLVKTNGTTLFALANGKLNAVDVRDATPRLLDTLKLEAGWSQELLLHGDRLLVLLNGGFSIMPMPGLAASIAPYQPATSTLAEVDVSDPSRLRLVRTLELDGSYVAARMVDSTVRIVSAAQVPSELPFAAPASQSSEAVAAAKARNRKVVDGSRAANWLPSYRIARAGKKAGPERPLVQCRHVSRPASFSGFGMLTVLTVDLAKGLQPVHSTSVMTDGRVVYASPENLYVASERWEGRPDPANPGRELGSMQTAIHRFDISSPLRTQYRGSGTVSGYLLNQWALSEHKGVLRAVSTDSPGWWGGEDSESSLTTLRARDGALVQAGRVGGLGKGERVYSVRFVGDTGYVVTFRQIDPLYTLDLADPARPRVLGELKIPGYSAYLHPIGEDLLLGVGQDATEQGRPTGTQLSIFDVSDLRRPTRLHTRALGLGWSEAEHDHHAFLFWPRTGLVMIPFNQEAVGFRVGRARGIDPLGRVEHGGRSAIRRSLVVRSSILTVSDSGVRSSTLGGLVETGWAAFPPAT